ncbi:APC family permease [Camelliibacillus cellulosilyticus]|uniref:APC family permease n=1 Tax=Camelliibacillus cellulosilyticus TaxID=2174486 RepID=A0ABV9GQG1_9BACL
MAKQGQFKRKLNLLDLTFLGCGSIIGSGWLYASMNAAKLAGPWALISWVIGAVMFILIGLVYAELSAALPRSGGFLRFPDYSHGTMVGYLIGFASLLGYTSVVGVEVIAVREYATYYWPALTNSAHGPTALGFIIQSALVLVFFLINYWSVNFFGKFNTVLTFFKFIVPLLIIIVLLFNAHWSNFSAGGADPGGIHGVFQAVVAAGIAFAYLGFRQSVDFAGEAKRPQRDVPWSIILSVVLCLILYLLLQTAFIIGVPGSDLANGWVSINWDSPWAQLAKTVGVIWLVNLILIDAVVSPGATGNIFLSGTARVMFAWAKNGYFYSIFSKVDKRTGLPRSALWLALIMGIAWTIPANFQTWAGLINAVTTAFVLTYMTGAVTAGAFRKRLPDMERPFKLKGMSVFGPLAFISSSLLALWSGWGVLSLLIILLIASLVLYFAFVDKDETFRKTLKEDFKACIWLFGFYAFMLIMSYCGSFGPGKWIPGPWDSVIVAIGSIAIYYWGVETSLKKPRITEDEENTDGVQAS